MKEWIDSLLCDFFVFLWALPQKLMGLAGRILILSVIWTCPTARADTVDCLTLAATPSAYAAPVPDSFNPNDYVYSFYIYGTVTNGCNSFQSFQGGLTGIADDPQVYSDLYLLNFDLEPGDYATGIIAGVVWLPSTPQGYVWNGWIERDNLFSNFTATAEGNVHVSCGVFPNYECSVTPFSLAHITNPEPSSFFLLSTGLIAVLWKLKK
jgi:hypothetical protein